MIIWVIFDHLCAHHNNMRMVLLIPPFFRWENWGLDGVNCVPEITRMETGKTRTEVRLSNPRASFPPYPLNAAVPHPWESGSLSRRVMCPTESPYKMYCASPAAELSSVTSIISLPPGQHWAFRCFSPNWQQSQLSFWEGNGLTCVFTNDFVPSYSHCFTY